MLEFNIFDQSYDNDVNDPHEYIDHDMNDYIDFYFKWLEPSLAVTLLSILTRD